MHIIIKLVKINNKDTIYGEAKNEISETMQAGRYGTTALKTTKRKIMNLQVYEENMSKPLYNLGIRKPS